MKPNALSKYLADGIIGGRSYKAVFRSNIYRAYQKEVDAILIDLGHEDLIER